MMQLEVSFADIEAMDDRYNSGMCDRSTANAVSIALRRRIRKKYTPIVEFAAKHHSCLLRIGEETYPLPQNLYWWLRGAEEGTETKPSRFSFAIPAGLLKKARQVAGGAGEHAMIARG